MDDYTSQILALIGNLLFFGVNILVTLVSFAFLSVTLSTLGSSLKNHQKNIRGPRLMIHPMIL